MESYTDSLVTQGLPDKEPEPAAVRGWRSRGLELAPAWLKGVLRWVQSRSHRVIWVEGT